MEDAAADGMLYTIAFCCLTRKQLQTRKKLVSTIEGRLPVDDAATEHSEESYAHGCLSHRAACTATEHTSPTVQIIIESALSGEQIFGPLRMQQNQKASVLVRKLQHYVYTYKQSSVLIRLTFNDCILDPSKPMLQYHAATEHRTIESEPTAVFKMIAEPPILTWEQLVAMPWMRKRAGRGGKAACRKQRELRALCLEKGIHKIDLARSDYNWPLLLKTMPCLNTPDVIGGGIVGFSFRFLSEIDPNYLYTRRWERQMYTQDHGRRHVFELNCANGDRWHLHFHQRGNCDRKHLPFDATQPW